jgi:transposase
VETSAVSVGADAEGQGKFVRLLDPTARKLIGYTGLCPRVYQSGQTDRRGPLTKNGPNYLRWALIEAAHTAGRTIHHRPIIERMRDRHGRRPGSALASVEIARRLTEAIWWMLSRNQLTKHDS